MKSQNEDNSATLTPNSNTGESRRRSAQADNPVNHLDHPGLVGFTLRWKADRPSQALGLEQGVDENDVVKPSGS